jgi:anti-sigma B factor antagonist
VDPLRISVAAGDRGPVLVLCGESDLTTTADLTEALTGQIDAGARHLTVDMSGLEFADSASIKALLQANRALKVGGGTMELTAPQPAVARALSLLGVDRLITVRPAPERTPAETEPGRPPQPGAASA